MQCTCAMLSSVACPALQYLFTLSHKRHNLRTTVTGYNMCVFSVQLLSATFLILCRTQPDMITLYIGRSASCDVPFILAHCNETWNFSTDFRRIFKYQISRQSVQWDRSCSVRTDGRTDMMKLILALWSFANALEESWSMETAHVAV
jgi:hypothetical protein